MNRVDIGPTIRAPRTGRKAFYTRYYVAWAYFRTTGSTAGTANVSILVGDGGVSADSTLAGAIRQGAACYIFATRA